LRIYSIFDSQKHIRNSTICIKHKLLNIYLSKP